jgi:glycosyltransferase involved in cell wall biosynthesis
MIDRLVVINDLAEPKGGATALALEGALACRDRGMEVTYICGDRGDNAALRERNIEIVALGGARLEAAGAVRALATGLYNPSARAMVARWMAQHDTPRTVYHVHGWAQILSPSIFAALKPVMERVVLHAHDFFLACPNGSFSFLKTGDICPLVPLSVPCVAANCDRRSYPHKLWRVARQNVLRNLCDLPHVPRVLAIHEAMRPFLMRAGIPDRAITALPNPVRPFSAQRIAAESNDEFLFVGRLEATKGPDLAAAAARAAGVSMRFIGDGELRASLEERYPDMIFTGRLPPAEIGAHAARARALVMPSRYPEPYGLVAAEALWSGLPVVAAETAFLAQDIDRAGAGASVNPRDIGVFGEVLRKILDDDAMTKAMSVAAFEGTGDIGLSPEAWTGRLMETYESAVKA